MCAGRNLVGVEHIISKSGKSCCRMTWNGNMCDHLILSYSNAMHFNFSSPPHHDMYIASYYHLYLILFLNNTLVSSFWDKFKHHDLTTLSPVTIIILPYKHNIPPTLLSMSGRLAIIMRLAHSLQYLAGLRLALLIITTNDINMQRQLFSPASKVSYVVHCSTSMPQPFPEKRSSSGLRLYRSWRLCVFWFDRDLTVLPENRGSSRVAKVHENSGITMCIVKFAKLSKLIIPSHYLATVTGYNICQKAAFLWTLHLLRIYK